MTTLREFLAARKSDVQSQIKALRKELQEIDAAERALGPTPVGPAMIRDPKVSGSHGHLTYKDMALGVLEGRPGGADAVTILQLIEANYGVRIKRESLSPQLSRLAAEGKLARNGLIWCLITSSKDAPSAKPESQKEETPGAATPDVSKPEEDYEIPF